MSDLISGPEWVKMGEEQRRHCLIAADHCVVLHFQAQVLHEIPDLASNRCTWQVMTQVRTYARAGRG